MLKAALAITCLVVVISVAAGVGSKMATGNSNIELMSGAQISPIEMMLKFDMTLPADEVKDLI
jgi:hypothetical protein